MDKVVVKVDGFDDKLSFEIDKNQLLTQVLIKPDNDSIFPLFVSGYNDIFETGYIGYWARGVYYDEQRNCWVCYETGDHGSSRSLDQEVKEEYLRLLEWIDTSRIQSFFVFDEENKETVLCFVIGVAFAAKAFVEAFKKWGQDSIDNWDAFTVDYGAQMALYDTKKWGY